MSIASIQSKYPNAVWFDSAHTGTETGSVTEPYNTIEEAITNTSSGGVIAIKDGTHNVSASQALTKALTFVGESTDAILNFNGSYGSSGMLDLTGVTGDTLIESLRIDHTGSATSISGLIKPGNGDLTIDGCKLFRTTGTSWFIGSGSTPLAGLYVKNSIITGRQAVNYGALMGNNSIQGWHTASFVNCNIFHTPNSGSTGLFSGATTGLNTVIVHNNIIYGADPSLSTTRINITPTSYKSNLYYNCNETSGGTGNFFNVDPQFVDYANADYRLRPSSPCISAGTAS